MLFEWQNQQDRRYQSIRVHVSMFPADVASIWLVSKSQIVKLQRLQQHFVSFWAGEPRLTSHLRQVALPDGVTYGPPKLDVSFFGIRQF